MKLNHNLDIPDEIEANIELIADDCSNAIGIKYNMRRQLLVKIQEMINRYTDEIKTNGINEKF